VAQLLRERLSYSGFNSILQDCFVEDFPMSQTVEQMPAETNGTRGEFDYRPLPPLAAVTGVLGVISILAVVTEFALPFAILGIVLGILAKRQISRSNGEYSGIWLVRGGLVLCAVCLCGGSAFHAYVYATEVPEGYERVSFVVDISKKDFIEIEGKPDFHPDVKALDGKQLFLKGYMYPDGRAEGLRQFILCKDSGECCFGGKPALTDMIFINIPDGVPPARYYEGLVAVAGDFLIAPDLRRAGELKPAYRIDASHFELARKLY
jgi:hypothetical protein